MPITNFLSAISLANNVSYDSSALGVNHRSRESRNNLNGHYIDNEQRIFLVYAWRLDTVNEHCSYSYVGILNKEVIVDHWLTFWKIENGNLIRYAQNPTRGTVLRSEYPKLY